MSKTPIADIMGLLSDHKNSLDMCTLDEEKNVHPCDLDGYAAWVKTFPGDTIPDREQAARKSGVVKQENVGRFWVSTTCLFLNHSWFGGPPQWFESMVFEDGDMGGVHQERYETYAEALAGHKRIVADYREKLNVNDFDASTKKPAT